MRIGRGGASGLWATGLGTLLDPRQHLSNSSRVYEYAEKLYHRACKA